MFACDFSSTAVDLVKQHPDYNKQQSENGGGGRCNAFVCDITKPEDWESNAPFQNESLGILACYLMYENQSLWAYYKFLRTISNYLLLLLFDRCRYIIIRDVRS